MHGIVKWFNEDRGYGFIISDSKEYFVHYKGIAGEGFKTLRDGDSVSFEPEKSPKGMIAVNVQMSE
jgi:CspA family cold shock protein